MAGVGDLLQRTGYGRTGRVLGGRAIGRSGGAMCGLHRACGDEEREFLGSASKPMSMVCEWVCLKTTGTVSHGFGPQNHSDGFLQFGLKIGGDGFWWFGIKTRCDGFLWFGLKTGGDGFSRFGHKISDRFLG
jgi:hypothetical protein